MIAIGSDHAGFEMKEALKAHLKDRGYEVQDFGTDSDASCDYPEFAKAVSHAVADGKAEKGVLICGTGIGMSMAANKIKGIRAAVVGDAFSAQATREHNDANVLAMPGRFVTDEEAIEMVKTFFSTQFEGGRHQNRVNKIPVTQ